MVGDFKRESRGSSLTLGEVPVYHIDSEQLLNEFNIDPKEGLSDERVAVLRTEYGSNIIAAAKGPSPLYLLVSQLFNAITVILLACLVVTILNQEWIDSGVIIGVIIINTIIGWLSEMKSVNSLQALNNMAKGYASVIRDGSTQIIDIDEVVVGDILCLRSGDIVPADARVIKEANLEVDEAMLTGESITIFKHTKALPIPQSQPGLDIRVALGDRGNMIFRNTAVVGGTGLALCVATGYQTKIGMLHQRMQNAKIQKTGFQKQLDRFMYILFAIALFLVFIIFCIVKFHITEDVIVYSAATAIALIPEALLMVTTTATAFAVSRLAAKKAIVRNLSCISELAALTHALSDKTGTLTAGKMTVKRVWPVDSPFIYHVSGGPYDATAGFGIEFAPNCSIAAADPQATSLAAQEFGSTRIARAMTRALTRASTSSYNVIGRYSSSFAVSGLGSPSAFPNSPPSRSRLSTYEPSRHGSYLASSLHDMTMQVITGSAECETRVVQNKCEELALVCAMCNNTQLQIDEENDRLIGTGNPTELALMVWTYKLGLPPAYFQDEYGWQYCGCHEFTSDTKCMSTGIIRPYQDQHGNYDFNHIPDSLILIKGAPEAILPKCYNIPDMVLVMDKVEHLASQGFRVLACATANHLQLDTREGHQLHHFDRCEVEAVGKLKFVGLTVLADPPREESLHAVQKCSEAGITFIMVTGDSMPTARNIARRLGILRQEHGENRVITGPEIDAMSPEQLDAMIDVPLVVARCSPESKVRIVEMIQRRGGIVSVTGDGMNDCPSLKVANVGFAMGQAGTNLTKEASDIVLADDNISTMVTAITEGRHITASAQKFIVHLASSNIAEVGILLTGLIFSDDDNVVVFPLMALQILLINLVTSSPPAIGLTMEKHDPDLMTDTKAFSKPFTLEVLVDQLVYGLEMAILCFVGYTMVIFWAGNGHFGTNCNSIQGLTTCSLVWHARTTTFASLYELLLIHGLVLRSPRQSIFTMNPFSNPVLITAVIIGSILLLPCIYIPWIANSLFKSAEITWEWGIVGINMIIHILFSEVYKAIKRSTWPLTNQNQQHHHNNQLQVLTHQQQSLFRRKADTLAQNEGQIELS